MYSPKFLNLESQVLATDETGATLYIRSNGDLLLTDEISGTQYLLKGETYKSGISLLQSWPTASLGILKVENEVFGFILGHEPALLALFSEDLLDELKLKTKAQILATPQRLLVKKNKRSPWEQILFYLAA